ncbi:aminobenzoate synthetase [Microbacterium oleivorans]|nr:aminobenzoate synthetase [Microbacterium oleivorans]
MLSSADPALAAAMAAGVDQVADAARRVVRIPTIVLVDGRSGAGKSTFADLLSGRLGLAALVRLDDVYPGWDGLSAGAETVRERVLIPLREGAPGAWPTWNWTADRPSGRERRVDPAPIVIVEGAGVLTPASAALADVTVWMDAPRDARRSRALERDGETYRPHWERWERQEVAHVREHDPQGLAQFVLALP